MEPLIVTDAIGFVVQRMRRVKGSDNLLTPYYMYGHRLDINHQLTDKDNDAKLKYQKYPLIALRLNVDESINNGLNEVDLDIAIVDMTDPKYNSIERMEKVIKPILIPLYNRFIKELGNSGLFSWANDSDIPKHKRRLCPYWGVPDKNGVIANIFNDPLDAIEITNLKLILSDRCFDSSGRIFSKEFSNEFN